MKKKLILLTALIYCGFDYSYAQCEINVSANPTTITCGETAVLTAFGSSTGQIILDEDFNSGGFGPGWGSTPGATSFSNPCSPGGVDGTPHAWMDNNTTVPRTLVSATYDLTAATAGVSICFDLLFAEQGDAAPCEGPDEPDEGVYLQYSTDGGATWIDIHYFDPNGGYDPQLTNWNNWCFEIPPAAITGSTMFRWHQTADSGANYDHWGIDNVQIFQNDINAEVIWQHDGYSYGVGNPGGDNPTAVAPTSTTTYTAQITTGTGDVCTADITIIVEDPIYDINVNANPTSICAGECALITGDAVVIMDPGGIETYENNQTESVGGFGVGSIGSSVNVNVQGINMSALTSGTITEVCINDFSYFSFGFPNPVTVADFEFVLVAPGGCAEIVLIPQGSLQPSSQFGPGLQNVCFTVGGATNLSSVPEPYSGVYQPNQSFDLANGCDPNGVWSIEMTAPSGISAGSGSFEGWSITFDDPPIYGTSNISWSPTIGLSNPASINTDACPVVSTDYELTVSNGTPGCATHTEIVSITVDTCGGCIPPNLIIDALNACLPSTVDLSDAIDPASDLANITYHSSMADAQNGVNPIGQVVGSTGSYWIRYEDLTDSTCYGVQEISVTISAIDDASFSLTDFCEGTANSASGIITPGGIFTFNPVPGGGVNINPVTGEITNGVAGTQYTVEYTTLGACPSSSTQNVTMNPNPTPVITGTFAYCVGGNATLDAGGPYSSYDWSIGGNQQTLNTTAAAGITVTVTDVNGCVGTSAPVDVIETTEIIFNDQLEICQGESVSIHGNMESTAGVYSVTLPTGSGCDSTANITLVVNALPNPIITGNLFYCSGESTVLDAGGPFISYDWSIGGNQQTINATAGAGITVTVTDANGCSATSAAVSVAAPPQAVVTATPNSGSDPLDVVLANGSTNASNYFWDFGNGSSLNINDLSSQNQTYTGDGPFVVMLVAEENGCSDTAYVTISIDNPMVIDIPNVFTPNNDSSNDAFFFNSINVASLEIIILNRWGNLIFESNAVNFLWDGKSLNGQDAKEGVYFFKYHAVGFDGLTQEGHGFVHLER